MTIRIALLLAGIPLLAPVPGAVESVAEAKQKLKGTWRAISIVIHGTPVEPDERDALRVVITDDMMILKWAAKTTTFNYRIDPNADPKQLDTTPLESPLKDIVCRGIYKFEGDRLILCKNTRGTEDRPKEYKTSLRSGFALYELKRENP